MSYVLSPDEIATLTDIANPASCLIHDGETIEKLLDKALIVWVENCFRLTDAGRQQIVLQTISGQRP